MNELESETMADLCEQRTMPDRVAAAASRTSICEKKIGQLVRMRALEKKVQLLTELVTHLGVAKEVADARKQHAVKVGDAVEHEHVVEVEDWGGERLESATVTASSLWRVGTHSATAATHRDGFASLWMCEEE